MRIFTTFLLLLFGFVATSGTPVRAQDSRAYRIEILLQQIEKQRFEIRKLQEELSSMQRPATIPEAYGGYEVYVFTNLAKYLFEIGSVGYLTLSVVSTVRAAWVASNAQALAEKAIQKQQRALALHKQLKALEVSRLYRRLIEQKPFESMSLPNLKEVEKIQLDALNEFSRSNALKEQATDFLYYGFVASLGWAIFKHLSQPNREFVYLTLEEKIELEDSLRDAEAELARLEKLLEMCFEITP